jgi:hypothetical protein
MLEAAQRATPTTYLFDGEPQNIWSAMLAAAPSQGGGQLSGNTGELAEAVKRMARAMRNGKAWPAVFPFGVAEQLAEDALVALEALSGERMAE